jgi:DNA invertase Pin-like site-specific DNA recombinase
MNKHIAIYARVSSKTQDTKSQEPDLLRWAEGQDAPIRWYRDKATGKNMDRPGWQAIEDAMRSGKISAVVCWRVDRLGRTASGLTTLFDELQQRKINLVSIKDGVDLSTPAGRMLANVLASVAQFEREIRGERQAAGISAAKSQGKTWGGSKLGVPKKVTPVQVRTIKQMKKAGESVVAIAKVVGLSRPTIYGVLRAK